ncbi:MAG: hypothetical protein M5U34_32250 [Chloroflexi bacterium]|nr:hypothetical protein [Chloroflexota bacterium]
MNSITDNRLPDAEDKEGNMAKRKVTLTKEQKAKNQAILDTLEEERQRLVEETRALQEQTKRKPGRKRKVSLRLNKHMTFAHDTFISPFTWRYGSAEMRGLWSEKHKRQLMRQVWLALAAAQQQADWSQRRRWPICKRMFTMWTLSGRWRLKKRRATMSWRKSAPSPSNVRWVAASSTGGHQRRHHRQCRRLASAGSGRSPARPTGYFTGTVGGKD